MKKEKLLIGIDPPAEVSKRIRDIKQQISRVSVNQQLVRENPHITMLVNNYTNLEAVSRALEELTQRYSPGNATVEAIRHWPGEENMDFRTLHAPIGVDRHLAKLQQQIAEVTEPYRRGSLLKEYHDENLPDRSFNKQEMANIDLYGYPYIGSTPAPWAPHLTVGILDKDAYKKIGEEIMGTQLNGGFDVNKLTLFRGVEGKGLVPHKTFKLRGKE